MTKPLNALLVEDSADDAELLLRELRRGEYAVDFQRVETREQLTAALARTRFDIVLSDFSLPSFDALQALAVVKESGLDLPFIIISGTMSEDVAVTAMRAGAHDYFSKGSLKRLLPAVVRELGEVEQRKARREADEALRRQAQQLAEQAHLLDLADVMARDLSGRIVLWTQGMESLYGWTKLEATGQLSHNLLRTRFPRPLAELEAEVKRVGVWDGELVHTTRSGKPIVVASHWALHRDLDGKPLAILEVNNDISERRRMEEALRNSEAQYRILFDGNPHPIWVYDLSTLAFLAVNEAAVTDYGYSRPEFLKMRVTDLRARATAPPAPDVFMKFDTPGVWEHLTSDGSLKEVEITAHEITFGNKRAGLMLALDVTEKRKTQRALQQQAEELAAMTQQLWQTSKLATMGELAASIAHELNNPLAIVSLRIETLIAHLSSDAPAQRSLEIVMGEVERMASLVTNLLQFTRRSHRQISTVAVAEEVTKSLEFIAYYLRNRKVEVVKDLDAPTPTIHADRQQLRQLFLNLITNASDAMPEGGSLTVTVRPESETGIAITFADTGKGIPANELEKIWEPFYTSKPEGKGTGLGLSICRRIVEEHRGAMRLTSDVGQGTTVSVIFPAANSQLTSDSEETIRLIAEDESDSNNGDSSASLAMRAGRQSSL